MSWLVYNLAMNTIGYFEIQADEPDRAISFYNQVFGWKFSKQGGLPIDYWMIETADDLRGGLLKRPVKAPAEGTGTNAFVCSMWVASFDETATKIMAAGGKVAMEKFAVPGKCWQGYFLDAEGNVFGIFEADENAA